MRRYKLKLKAGESTPLSVVGDYFRVISGEAEFSVQPDTGASLAGLESGMSLTTEKPFSKLTLQSAVSQDVSIIAGKGKIDDNRTSISGSVDVFSKGLSVESSSSSAAGVAVEVLSQDVGRRSVLIKNIDLAESVYIGGSGVSVTNGLPIDAGESLVIDKAAGAALFAVTSGASVELRILAEVTG